ncbi:MAG: hypothetical protein NVS2B7_07260 [Herpetosiphon sp.]
MFKWISRVFRGDSNARVLADLEAIVEQINALEPTWQQLSDQQLFAKTDEFRRRLRDGETTDDILPEAFSTVREAARRVIGQRHYDVQLIGGIVLHQGKIAEMKTGEGKTLVATLPLYLNSLEGKGAHLITVNDYLVRVGAGWMGPIYHLLGVTVSYVAHDQSAIYDPDYLDPKANLEDQRLVHWRPVSRREAYEADITYGTNNEFGFDYLRDNITTTFQTVVQRPLHYAIVDEVDNILIDEARTPLIISGPARQTRSEYSLFASIVRGLRGIEEREWTSLKREMDGIGNAQRRAEIEQKLDATDYVIDLKQRTVTLTDTGTLKMERKVKDQGRIPEEATLYDPEYAELAHYLDNAVKSEYMYKRDKDYIIQNGEVIIVDEQTGRVMPGRRWSDGLHEAIESKEGVQVQQENTTLATVTIQNYFRMYKKLSGMTGTALTEGEEFAKIYKLDVVPIPTNQDVVRDDLNDQIFRSEEAKYRAVVREILGAHVNQRPVLVGTASIEHNERLAAYLKPAALRNLALSSVLLATVRDAKKVPEEIQRSFEATLNQPLNQVPVQILRTVAAALNVPADPADPHNLAAFADLLDATDEARLARLLHEGVRYNVLNAKLHEKEAGIVAQAGRSGGITLATNMAGRGTDILLGGNPESLAAQYLEDHGVKSDQIKALARMLVEKDAAQARIFADRSQLPPVLVDELQGLRADFDLALSQWESNPALYLLNRFLPGDAETFAPRWQLVNDVLVGETGMAREIVAATPGLREEKIAELMAARADMESYRADRVDFIANHLFDRIYAARANLIAAVLHGDETRANAIVAQTPTMDPSLIEGIRQIKRDVDADADKVRQLGGLHVIGTERHEARRIDNQLRGRAGRQGDPGSSRFYISLEDELMKRFGPSIDRVKGIMARAGFEDDLPLEFGIISRQIESAQTKVEGYNFDMRKRVVEYDDVMNKQREVIYARRRAILEQGEQQRRIAMLVERYLAGYADWAIDQVEELAGGSEEDRSLRKQLEHVLPGAADLGLQQLHSASEEERAAMLHPLIEHAVSTRYPLRLLLSDVGEFVSLDSETAWNELQAADRPAIERYLDEHWRAATEGELEQRIKDLFMDELEVMHERYLANYDTWMLNQITETVEAATTQATNSVNIEGALRRLAPRLPAVATLDTVQFRNTGPEVLQRHLETLIRPSREQGNHLRLFAQDLLEILPFISNVSPQDFLYQFGENLDAVLIALPEAERATTIMDLLVPVQEALVPVLAGQEFTPEQGALFQGSVEEAWMGALDRLATLDGDDIDRGLETYLDLMFDRWRSMVGVDMLNRYSRDLILSTTDREWVDYLTAIEELRQGIGLQGIAQRDPLVAYKTEAFRMFEDLLHAIDESTVRGFFVNLPNWVMQLQAQSAYGQAARSRDMRVGPNEPCPCGSGKKFKKCHGVPGRAAAASGRGGVAPVLATGSDDGAAKRMTQQQRDRQASAGGQRRKSKGRDVPGRGNVERTS